MIRACFKEAELSRRARVNRTPEQKPEMVNEGYERVLVPAVLEISRSNSYYRKRPHGRPGGGCSFRATEDRDVVVSCRLKLLVVITEDLVPQILRHAAVSDESGVGEWWQRVARTAGRATLSRGDLSEKTYFRWDAIGYIFSLAGRPKRKFRLISRGKKSC